MAKSEAIVDRTMAAMRTGLAGAAEPAYRAQIEKLVPGIRTRGVRVPRIRALAAARARTDRTLDAEAAAGLLDTVSTEGCRDEILYAAFLLARFRKALPQLAWTRVAAWLKAVDNWETCDQLAMTIAAPMVAANPALLPRLQALTRDRNPWARRFALATAAALTQKGRGRTDACLGIAARLMTDDEPLVQKALAWALRAASEGDPAGVAALLHRHRGQLPVRVLREASAKLPVRQRAALLG